MSVAACSSVPGLLRAPVRCSLPSPSPSAVLSVATTTTTRTSGKPGLTIFSSKVAIGHSDLERPTSVSSRAVRAMASSDAAVSEAAAKPFAVLFVCLGNICRSPAGEGVFRDVVKKRGLESKFNIDSAGTINYHEGNLADPRMRSAARTRGIEITSISRPIRSSDFKDFDLILAMDKQNREDILDAFGRWKARDSLPADAATKVKLMCSYCKRHKETEVPDPYYGGPQGFEKVLDMLEDACESLLDSIVSQNQHILGHGPSN
ncbi:putative low molecular weight protein-tyrosine-phosphatase [Nymphaea thermarum]|nr:putative low molecular weight protein-tyrosine-phosphatase [Nymphaea thermarum]